MNDLFKEAENFIKEGKLQEAIVIYEHIVQRVPEMIDARHDLARLLMEVQEVNKAIEVLQEGVCLQANSAPLWFLLGLAQLRMSDYAESLKSFKQVEVIDGLSTALVLNMGVVHRELGSVSAGLELLEQWYQHTKDEPQLYCLIAELYMEGHEWDKAMQYVKEGRKIEQSDANLCYLEGILLCRKSKWLEAIPLFQNILQNNPNLVPVKHELAWAFVQIEHTARAIELLEECLQLSPEKTSLWFDLAMAYTQIPDFEKAMEMVLEAQKRDPDNEKVPQLIAEILEAKKQMGID